MLDPAGTRAFPTDDSLCERCGYPLRGLPIEADCPECGQAVAESSPAKRVDLIDQSKHDLIPFWKTVTSVLVNPRGSFRRLRIESGHDSPRAYLTRVCFFASVIWAGAISFMLSRPGWPVSIWGFSLFVQFVLLMLVLHALTYIEMLGVTAFSRRRGWRVPFRLAERVCCYASVGWLPGVMVAAVGFGLLAKYAAGEPWFEQYLGLVRVSWICYGGLFVLSLLWFETLVWLGVRQVRYANAWPDDGLEA